MDDRRRSRSLLRHRLPALTASTLSTLAVTLSFASGFSCNFLTVTPTNDDFGNNELSGSNDEGGSIGIFCPSNPTGVTNAGGGGSMHTLSVTFLSLSLTTGLLLTVLAHILALLVPPTERTWRVTSILAGTSCILSVPAFLMLESDWCKGGSTGGEGLSGQCAMSTGAILLVVSTALYGIVAAVTSIVSPPVYYEVRENWTVGKKSGVAAGLRDGVTDAFDAAGGWVDRKRDWRLRYIGTESTDGDHDAVANGRRRGRGLAGAVDRGGGSSLDDDDEARDLEDDVRDLEAGEFTGLTIEYARSTDDDEKGDGGVVVVGGGAAQQAPVSPITPARGLNDEEGGGAAAAAATAAAMSDPADLELGAVSAALAAAAVNDRAPSSKRRVSDVDKEEEVLALDPTAHDPNSLDDWSLGNKGNSKDRNADAVVVPPSPSPGYNSESDTTSSSLNPPSQMAQLQTSRLDDSDGEGVRVIYKDRPPAYNLSSPYEILDEEEERKRKLREAEEMGQQYWADEGAHLARSFEEVEDDDRLVENKSRGSGDGSGSSGKGREGAPESASAAVPDNNNNSSSILASSPKRRLIERSQNLRSTLRSLGRKLSDRLEGGGVSDPAAAAASSSAKTKSTKPAVGSYFPMESEDGGESRSGLSSSNVSSIEGEQDESEIDRFVDEIENDADDEQTDDEGDREEYMMQTDDRGLEAFPAGASITDSSGAPVGSSPLSSSSSRRSMSLSRRSSGSATPNDDSNELNLSALLEEVLIAGGGGGGGVVGNVVGTSGSSDEEPPPPPPPEEEFDDSSDLMPSVIVEEEEEGGDESGEQEEEDGASPTAMTEKNDTSPPLPTAAAAVVDAGDMPDDEFEAYATQSEPPTPSPPKAQRKVPGGEGNAAAAVAAKQEEQFADPEVQYYTSASEAEEETLSDLEISFPNAETVKNMKMMIDLEDMPDDELAAYTSDDGSLSSAASASSYTSGSSGGEEGSSYAGDDSSLSSSASNDGVEATTSEDDENDSMADIIAGVLERQQEKRRKQKSRVGGSLRDRRRRRRKKKKNKRRSRYSSANSISSRTSLLDETIEEETDMDLREMEESPEEDNAAAASKDMAGSDGGGAPHEMIMTDLLVAGARITDDKDLLNTIIETSFTKAGSSSDGEKNAETEKGGVGAIAATKYEAGYLSRSPATSDSENNPLSAFRRIVTPSASRRPKSSYASLKDSRYHSAPEALEDDEHQNKKEKEKARTPATVVSTSPDSMRSTPSAEGGYLSDSRRELGSRHRQLLGIDPVSYSSSPEGLRVDATNVVSDDEDPAGRTRRRVETTLRRVRTHSLPPVLHQISHGRGDGDYLDEDDAVSLQDARSPTTPYPLPTSWKNERRFRSPLHCPDAVSYYSDSSSNTDGSASGRSARSMRSSASRNARAARKKRLSMQRGGPARVRSRTCEPPMKRTFDNMARYEVSPPDDDVGTMSGPHVISLSGGDKKAEKPPKWPSSNVEAVDSIMESMSQL